MERAFIHPWLHLELLNKGQKKEEQDIDELTPRTGPVRVSGYLQSHIALDGPGTCKPHQGALQQPNQTLQAAALCILAVPGAYDE